MNEHDEATPVGIGDYSYTVGDFRNWTASFVLAPYFRSLFPWQFLRELLNIACVDVRCFIIS